ncbi:MAG TPA: adenylate/guanylate cyclase domain-containing protein [Nitrospirota bacterium]|nr:adenylate/guanylate cyclase domain-containing protein [Nitrospirota bacterium]
MMKKSSIKKVGIYIALVVAIALSVLHVRHFRFFEVLEEKTLDLRFTMRGKVAPGPETVIAVIDEKSINKLGRFPWPRSVWGRVVDRLTEEGSKVIVFDVFFSERESVESDDLFQRAIMRSGRVILPVVFDFSETGYKESGFTGKKLDFMTPSAYSILKNADEPFLPLKAKMVLPTLLRFSAFAKALAHINMIPDMDGTIRWEVLAIQYQGDYYAPIGLQAARLYRGLKSEDLALDYRGSVQLGDTTIPVDGFGRMLINFRGPNNTFPMYSISDILDRTIRAGAFRDKIVLIGATAQGIYDLRVTPFSTNMAGIEKHASVVDTILRKDFIYRTEATVIPLILLFAGILGIYLPRLGAKAGAGLFLALFVGYGWIVYYLFISKGIWFNFVYPSSALVFGYTSQTAYRFFTEERRARDIRKMFSSYVSKRIVDELIRDPSKARLGGERKEITVLFSDIRGFTSFSEKHQPEEVVSMLNEYLGAMTDIVFKYDGTLDKFIGDAIMALWGAPIGQPDHAERAVRCALAMGEKLGELQKKWADEGKPVLDTGIGINTGEMVVGNMGAEGKKMDYTVIGDHVNLGARVESLTRQYNNHIIITEFTYEKVKDIVEVNKLGSVTVKGKERPLVIYDLVGVKG